MQTSSIHSIQRSGAWLAALALVGMSVTTASAIDPAITIGGYYQQLTDTTSTNPPTDAQCLDVKHCWLAHGA